MPSPKDILLINPWIYDFTAYDFWLKPLGLLCVAALLKKNTGFRLSFIDCLDRQHPKLPKAPRTKPDGRGPYFKEEVAKPDILKNFPRRYSRYGIPVPLFLDELEHIPPPDLVLITCTMTYWYPGVQFAVELVRDKFGDVPVILGGIYASLLPDHARRSTGADFIYEGPAEKALGLLLEEIFGDDFRFSSSHPPQDVFIWPDYSLLRDTENLPVLTSKGCPFSCSFCATPLLNPEFRQDSPSSVVAQIESLYFRFMTKNIVFYDDALLLNKRNHIIPILEGIIQKELPVNFHTPNGLHVKEIDEELSLLFKKANVTSLYLSQESLDENVLRDSCPKVEKGDLEKALFHLERAGYQRTDVNVYLIVGLPDQDMAGIKNSITQVQKLGARPRLAYFSPVPGTPEWQGAVEKGYIDRNADPLLHNKLTFPYLWGNVSPDEFRSMRSLL